MKTHQHNTLNRFAASLLALASIIPASALASPFQNGTFDLGLLGWTHLNGTGDGNGSSNFVFNSNQYVGDGILYQPFDTLSGQQYAVTFDFTTYGGPTSGYLQTLQSEVRDGNSFSSGSESIDVGSASLSPNGNVGMSLSQVGSVVTVSDSNSGDGSPRSTVSFTFTALSGSSTLVFTDQTGGAGQFTDSILDTVTVTTVPEPSTCILLLSGLALGLRRRTLRPHERSA